MTAIADRIAEKRKDLSAKIGEDLASKSLSRLLRRETWADHARAEYSAFEVALVKGTVPRRAYLDLLQQVYPVYCAIEERIAQLADHPIAGQVHFEGLNRKEALEADLDFYGGADWRETTELLPVTKEYIERIKTVDEVRFIAHHYNRYLADLSGGLMIRDGLKDAWDLDGKGLVYYDFPDIPNPTEFKNAYRGTLDQLPLTVDQKLDLIEEAMIAYEFNIQMVNLLGEKYLEDNTPVAASHH